MILIIFLSLLTNDIILMRRLLNSSRESCEHDGYVVAQISFVHNTSAEMSSRSVAVNSFVSRASMLRGVRVSSTFNRIVPIAVFSTDNEMTMDLVLQDESIVSVHANCRTRTADTRIRDESFTIRTNLDVLDSRTMSLDGRYEWDDAASGQGIRVYVVDSGIHIAHSEFKGRAIGGWSMCSEANVVCDNAWLSEGVIADDHIASCDEHGTHVASIVNGYSVGVAKSATVISVQTLSCMGDGTLEHLIYGMEWIVENNAGRPSVVQMSLGGSGRVPILDIIIDQMISANIVVVVASGNENSNASLSFPASSPGAITVGSVDLSGKRSSFSNYGESVDVHGPGESIWAAYGLEYYFMSGTSMACPHVSGSVAQFRSAFPNMDARTTRTRILELKWTKNILRDMRHSRNLFVYAGKDMLLGSFYDDVYENVTSVDDPFATRAYGKGARMDIENSVGKVSLHLDAMQLRNQAGDVVTTIELMNRVFDMRVDDVELDELVSVRATFNLTLENGAELRVTMRAPKNRLEALHNATPRVEITINMTAWPFCDDEGCAGSSDEELVVDMQFDAPSSCPAVVNWTSTLVSTYDDKDIDLHLSRYAVVDDEREEIPMPSFDSCSLRVVLPNYARVATYTLFVISTDEYASSTEDDLITRVVVGLTLLLVFVLSALLSITKGQAILHRFRPSA